MKLARIWTALTLVAACAMASAPAATRQAPALIDVAVTNGQSETVSGLTAADFEILVDGKPRPIESFAAPPVPLALVLLVDVTASMAAYTDTDDIVGAFAGSLIPGDRAAVAGLANRTQIALRFGDSARDVVAGARSALRFKKEDKFGPSPIWDALDAVVEALRSQAGRRGIVLVTDGRATGNRIGSQTALERAVLAGLTVAVLTEGRSVLIRQDAESVARVRPGLMLQELARLTGGLVLPDETKLGPELPDVKRAIAQLVKDLRDRYTLGVAPQGPPGSLHRVEVRVKRPGASVRARSVFRS